MKMHLSNTTKGKIAAAINSGGLSHSEFILSHTLGDEKEQGFVRLDYKNGKDRCVFSINKDGTYTGAFLNPETGTTDYHEKISIPGFLNYLTDWVRAVKTEHNTVDPWAKAEEEIGDEDTKFTPLELKSIDKAIDLSIDELERLAIENGQKLDNISSQLSDMKTELKSAARKNSRYAWVKIFKDAIIQKMMDWGIELTLASGVITILLSNAKPLLEIAAKTVAGP